MGTGGEVEPRSKRDGLQARASALLPILYSASIIVLGAWVSISTGEWIALVCAAGLLVLPLRPHRRSAEPMR